MLRGKGNYGSKENGDFDEIEYFQRLIYLSTNHYSLFIVSFIKKHETDCT